MRNSASIWGVSIKEDLGVMKVRRDQSDAASYIWGFDADRLGLSAEDGNITTLIVRCRFAESGALETSYPARFVELQFGESKEATALGGNAWGTSCPSHQDCNSYF